MKEKRVASCVLAVFGLAWLVAGNLTALGQEAKEAGHKPLIVLVGDSTVTDKAGWGAGFQRFLNETVACTNTSRGGRSSKSFIGEGLWSRAKMLKGDYYLIQFGHNDEPGKGPARETDPDTTFMQFMGRYVDESRAIGAMPVLLTPLTRRHFKDGKFSPTALQIRYAAAVRKLAAEKKVPLIDLFALSVELCEKLGPEKCNELSPMKEGTKEFDNTHLNAKGGVVFAGLVVEELRKAVPQLAPCLRKEPGAETGAGKAGGGQ